MKDSDKKQMAEWVKNWKRTGSALKEIKRRELQSFDYEKNRIIIDEMLQWACDNQKVRLTSGLVEQQRLFMRLREKQGQSSQHERPQRNP